MSRGTVPIQTCDDELGCDQWMVDNYEIGAANWRELLDGWTYDPRDDLAYCPGHQPVTDHDFVGVAGHPDDDECNHRADGTDATYCGQPEAAHQQVSGGDR